MNLGLLLRSIIGNGVVLRVREEANDLLAEFDPKIKLIKKRNKEKPRLVVPFKKKAVGTYFFRRSISLGISSHPRSMVPRLPLAHSFSQNLVAFPSPILSPDMSTGTGVSL